MLAFPDGQAGVLVPHVEQASLPAQSLISGSDISPEAVQAVRVNRKALPGGESIKVRRADFQTLEKFENTTLVTNPPYGKVSGEA